MKTTIKIFSLVCLLAAIPTSGSTRNLYTHINSNVNLSYTINDTLKTVNDTTFADLEDELNDITKKENTDTTKIRVGKLKISVIDDGKNVVIQKEKSGDDWDSWDNWDDFEKKSESGLNKNFNPHIANFSLGLNNYITSDQNLTLPDTARYLDLNTNRSLEFALNFAELGIPIVKHRMGISTGMGIKWNNYNFKNANIVLHSDSTLLYHTVNDSTEFSKSKLSVFYLTVPFMLEFQAPINKKPLFLSAGVEAGLKIGSRTKMKTSDGVKYRNKNDFHIMPYTLSLAARIGYDNVGFYATYNLSSLFKVNEGPNLYPFAMGINLYF